MTAKPTARPARAHFSSGPCAKRPGYDLSTLPTDSLGRSHRAKIGKTRLKDAIDRTRAVLSTLNDRIGARGRYGVCALMAVVGCVLLAVGFASL